MLKQIGIIRNKTEVREVFEADGKIIAFNEEQSTFDVLCEDSSLISFPVECIDNADMRYMGLFVDEQVGGTVEKMALIVPRQDGQKNLICYYVTEEILRAISINLESLSFEDKGPVMTSYTEIGLLEIQKFMRNGTGISVEDSQLIREYKYNYLTT